MTTSDRDRFRHTRYLLTILGGACALIAGAVGLASQAHSGWLRDAPELVREVLGLLPTKHEPLGVAVLVVTIALCAACVLMSSYLKSRMRRAGGPTR